jgi:hypothetical protein
MIDERKNLNTLIRIFLLKIFYYLERSKML